MFKILLWLCLFLVLTSIHNAVISSLFPIFFRIASVVWDSHMTGRHWTYEMLVRYILFRVCLRWSHYFCIQYQLMHFSYDNHENIYASSFYHHQIRNMFHQPLFRFRSWKIKCAVYFAMFFLLEHQCSFPSWHEFNCLVNNHNKADKYENCVCES